MRLVLGPVALALVATGLLAGCSSGAAKDPVTVTVSAPASDGTTVANTAATPSGASASPTSTRESASGGKSASGSFVMPNEIGQGLQHAQDDLQRVSGNPIFISHSTDASGQGRHQILDRDWKVCTQNVAPGTQVNQSSDISFGTVKVAEPCP